MTGINRRDFLRHGSGMATAFLLMPEVRSLFASSLNSVPPVPSAVIGLGKQGRLIMGELAKFPFVKIAAICDINSSRLRSGKRRTQEAIPYEDYQKLLESEKDVHAVFVATPTHLHRDIAIASLQAEKHVYCEAPLASTVEDCKKIAKAAKNAKTVFHVGLQMRSNPIYKLARTFLRSGAIGDMIFLRGQFQRKTSWAIPASNPSDEKSLNWRLYKETSTGLAGEEGSHQFDVVNWFLEQLPLSVSGRGQIKLYQDGREIPDTIQCVLTYPGSLQMAYSASLGCSFEGQYELFNGHFGAIKTVGNLGWMFKEADAPTQGWEVYAIKQRFHIDEGITLIADATKLAKQGKLREGIGLPHPPLYFGLQDFLVSVTESKPSACPAPVGLRAAVVGIKAHEAVMSAGEIAFEEEWFKIDSLK